jgi:hypothetical protein
VDQLSVFWEHMMKVFRSREVPAFYIRYEDLYQSEVIDDVCKYILNKKSVDGTVISKRVKDMDTFDDMLSYPKVLS